jgi:hypothetical protein
MYYAGIDAHATYLMVAVVDPTGTRVLAPTRGAPDRVPLWPMSGH